MLQVVDLSYYKILPQQFGSMPKMLVSEITNEIEFYACTDLNNASINYAVSKVLEAMEIPHEPVFWGSDLIFNENKFVSITKFNLNQNWVNHNDKEILSTIKNENDLNFSYLLSALFSCQCYKEDALGHINDDNIFIKSFYYNMMFEVELALFASKNARTDDIFGKIESIEEVINDEEDEIIIQKLESYLKRFMFIKKSDWFDILQFPKNEKFEKAKFWSIKKIIDAQKVIKKMYQ